MNKFKKIVAVDPTRLPDAWIARLADYGESVLLFPDIPKDKAEILDRIGDADCVLVNLTTRIGENILAACPDLKYVGMCCSLYTPESANVDIAAATRLGIVVLGVRDYGDEGVAEYVVSELVRLLHGFGAAMWREYPVELTNLNVGIIGMGATGKLIARALKFFGANIFYNSRTRKPDLETTERYVYQSLDDLLATTDIVCTCLHKNVVVLHEPELERFGNGKIIVNIGLSPSFSQPAIDKWLQCPGNYLLADMARAIDPTRKLLDLPNVLCVERSAGMTSLARERLGAKVIANIESFLSGKQKLRSKEKRG